MLYYNTSGKLISLATSCRIGLENECWRDCQMSKMRLRVAPKSAKSKTLPEMWAILDLTKLVSSDLPYLRLLPFTCLAQLYLSRLTLLSHLPLDSSPAGDPSCLDLARLASLNLPCLSLHRLVLPVLTSFLSAH